jgi:hypothetical protein
MGGGVNDSVWTLLPASSYLFIGGKFTQAYFNTSPVNYQYIATWNGSSIYDYVGGNAFNAAVNTIQYTNSGNFLFVGGDFTHTGYIYTAYIDYIAPNTIHSETLLIISNPLTRGSTFYNGNTFVSTQNNGIKFLNYPTWVNDDDAVNGFTPSFIGNLNGQLNVAYQNTGDYYQRTTLSQNGVWQLTSGNFKFNTTLYTIYTIGIRDQAQQFIGDLTGGTFIWREIGYNPWGTFS